MQRALLAALLVGITAPAVGIYLVQRRLALIGDGIGHVALTGVALGVLTGWAPVLTALVLAVVGAVAIELMRAHGRTSGDIALAVMFYGGIAGGVLLIGSRPAARRRTSPRTSSARSPPRQRPDLWTFAALPSSSSGSWPCSRRGCSPSATTRSTRGRPA